MARRWRHWWPVSCAVLLNVAAVKAPGFGDRRKAMLQDIAILTGGKAITEDLGIKLEGVKIEDLGTAKRQRSTRTTPPSSMAAGKGSDIEGRVKEILLRSRRPLLTTTARSCRSVWPSWLAALQ